MIDELKRPWIRALKTPVCSLVGRASANCWTHGCTRCRYSPSTHMSASAQTQPTVSLPLAILNPRQWSCMLVFAYIYMNHFPPQHDGRQKTSCSQLPPSPLPLYASPAAAPSPRAPVQTPHCPPTGRWSRSQRPRAQASRREQAGSSRPQSCP